LQRAGWLSILANATFVAVLGTFPAWSQDPASPASTPSTTPTTPPAPASQPGKKKPSHANDFLIRGTVFTEQALAFPGVQVRIRRASEKKFRWETYTDSRGEFAVRVPQGTAYEMLIHVKGFADQTRTVDATAGDYEGNIVFRMMPGKGDKK